MTPNICIYIHIHIICIPKHTVFPTMFPKYSYISLSNSDHVSTVPSGVIKPWGISIATITKVRPLNDQLLYEALNYISYPSYMRQHQMVISYWFYKIPMVYWIKWPLSSVFFRFLRGSSPCRESLMIPFLDPQKPRENLAFLRPLPDVERATAPARGELESPLTRGVTDGENPWELGTLW